MKQIQSTNPLDDSLKAPEFKRKRRSLTVIWILVSAALVFAVEFILMYSLHAFARLSTGWIIFLDGFFLVLILFPLIYGFVIRPILRQAEERRLANIELARSHELLEHFFSITDMSIAYLDREFNFIRVNQTYADSDNRPAKDFIGKNHFVLFPNEENQVIFQSVVDTGKPFRILDKPFEYAEHPERGISYWDWNLFPIKDAGGQVIELLLTLNNVTERKLAQAEIAEKDRRLTAVFEQTYQHSILLDPSGAVLTINQSGLEFIQCDPAALIGKSIWQIPCWETISDKGFLQGSIKEAANGKMVRHDYELTLQSGEIATMATTLKSILDPQGNTEILLFEVTDISQRIQAEEAIKQSEAQVAKLYLAEKKARENADLLRDAALTLANSLDIDTILETLLDYLKKVMTYESAHILLFDENNSLVVSHARGEEDWIEKERLHGRIFELEELNILDPLFNDQQVVFVTDTKCYSETTLFSRASQVASWVAIPLIVGNQIIGICFLEHSSPDFFTSDVPQWARTLVNQSAIAIQSAWLFEQISESRERLQALSRRLVEVQENERRYVAQELHDDAGQALASLKVGLKLLEKESSDPNAIKEKLRQLNRIADEVLENLHRLAVDLRPTALDHLGLVAALQQHTDLLSSQQGITINFNTVGDIERLPGEIETAIYRIVQEALTNVIKHAKATRVDILLERRSKDIRVIVEDNGVGFPPNFLNSGHLGAVGMSERAEMLGGSLRIESAPGEGSAVFLEVPCPSES